MESLEMNKLFVGNLHWDIRRQELKEYFGQRGEVVYASVALDRDTGRSRWFGFVTFANEEEAKMAEAEANEQEFKWRPMYIDFARARQEDAAQGEEWETSQEEVLEEVEA